MTQAELQDLKRLLDAIGFAPPFQARVDENSVGRPIYINDSNGKTMVKAYDATEAQATVAIFNAAPRLLALALAGIGRLTIDCTLKWEALKHDDRHQNDSRAAPNYWPAIGLKDAAIDAYRKGTNDR